MFVQNNPGIFLNILKNKPNARANIKGSAEYPTISGTVSLYQTNRGVLVVASITGLPDENLVCIRPVFAMHIHSGGSCTGNASDPFADTGGHYNPGNCLHPHHAGDLPPLFSNSGFAWLAVLTNRFRVNEVIGKTVIIHESPDDFSTQPAGNAGKKIACGVIKQ